MFAFVGTRSAGHAAPEEIIIERAADKSIARLPFIPFFFFLLPPLLPSFRYAEGILKHWKTFKDVVENGIFSAQVRLESVRFPARRRNLFHGSSNLFCRWITARPYPSGAARGCETRGERRQKEREEARIFEADGDERKG